MSPTKTAKPYKSGFCTPGNPADSHDRCPREYQGRPCVCECHEVERVVVTAALPIGSPPVSATSIEVGLVEGLSNDAYHAETEWLSSSQLKSLLPEHYKTGGSSEALAFGSLFHAIVLEPERIALDYVALDAETVGVKADGSKADNPTATKAWRETVADAEASGLTVVDQSDLDRARAMRDAAWAHPEARKVLFTEEGRNEISLFAIDADGNKHKARFDRLLTHSGVDLKSTAAKPGVHSLTSTVLSWGYHVSAAHYMAVAELLGIELPDPFTLVFVGKEPPYRVSVCDLDDLLIQHGREQRDLAIQRAHQLVEPYEGATGRLTLWCPGWALSDDEMVVA